MTGAPQTKNASALESARRCRKIRSPAGIEAWLVEDHTLPLVSIAFGVARGASLDPIGKEGLVATTAALLREGAGGLDATAYRRALAEKAIQVSFSCDDDSFRGELRTLSHHADVAFDLLALAIRAPRFDASSLDRVRAQTSARLKWEANDPASAAKRLFFSRGYAGHAYGRPLFGTESSLANIARADVDGLYSTLISRADLRIAIVGAIDEASAGVSIDKVFADLPTRAARSSDCRADFCDEGSIVVDEMDVPQSAMQFGRRGIPRGDPDFFSAMVVNQCLGGGGFSSRLFREARERRGLCYSISTQNVDFAEGAALVGSTAVRNDRVCETLEVIGDEIGKLASKGLDDDELAAAKRYLVGSYALRFDTSMKMVNLYLSLQINGYSLDWPEIRRQSIEAVDAGAARRASERLFGDGRLLIAIAGRPVGLDTAGSVHKHMRTAS